MLSSCTAMLLTLGAVMSPYMLWSSFDASGSYGTGPFVLSQVFRTTTVGQELFLVRLTTSYGLLDDSACLDATQTFNISGAEVQVNNFEDWGGKYGFCSAANGTASTPTEARVIQASSTLAAVLAFVVTLVACDCREAGSRSPGNRSAGALAIAGSALAVAAFAQAASWTFYTDLRSGTGYLPAAATLVDGSSGFVGVPISDSLALGPAFVALVMAALLLAYAGLALCLLSRAPVLDDDDLAGPAAKTSRGVEISDDDLIPV